ncbi:MAG: hypothetical protein GVX78_04390 [Bacteroidetes bacterium]|jgi:hypothetical protein|nr:hypothetical protein [Bacteroidota bacterium]
MHRRNTGRNHKLNPIQKAIGPVALLASGILFVIWLTGWEIDEPDEEKWVLGLFLFFLVSGIVLTRTAFSSK